MLGAKKTRMLGTQAVVEQAELAETEKVREEELITALNEQLRLADKRKEYLKGRGVVLRDVADRLAHLDELYREVL